MQKLTAVQVEKAKPREKAYKLSDGGGFYLFCHPNGGRYWRYDYRFAGKRLTLALGIYPDVKLADARKSHQAAREWLAKGCDPSSLKRQNRLLQHEVVHNTFGLLSAEWFEVHMSGKSEGHAIRQQRILDKDLLPSLRHRPIEEITAPELLVVLRKVEARTIDIAHRANQILKAVFNYSIDTGRLTHNPALNLSRALKRIETKHFAAITSPKELRPLLLAIEEYKGRGIVKIALKLSVLLFQRPGEIRTMRWSEINWEKLRWERAFISQKSRRDHISPLPAQAVLTLREMKEFTGTSEYVFPNGRDWNRPMSDNGVRTALRAMGFSKEVMTPHGFRAMARTILEEELGYSDKLAELQISHKVHTPMGRAYDRTAFLPERAEMMQGWADYLDQLAGAITQ